MEGWIKLHRKILDNPVVCKDADHFSVWCYLLLEATHKPYDIIWSGERITLAPGQLIVSRKSISKNLKVSESKVERILKLLKSEQQIEQRTNFQSRLITILSWSKYQESEQRSEQRVNSDRTASEQRVNTNKNIKNIKNDKNKEYIVQIVSYLNERANTNFRSSGSKTKQVINARLNEKYSLDDFKKVIDNKCNEWLGTEHEKYLRPETLFGNKFEGYLNQKPKPAKAHEIKDRYSGKSPDYFEQFRKNK